MRSDRLLRPFALAVAIATSLGAVFPSSMARAQVMFFDSAKPITFEEEIARYLPGVANYRKGLDLYKKGQPSAAIEAWEVSSGWAMKDAQYSLGLAYFKGDGIAADRPRGLAWLALAAERKNPRLQASLAAAWDSASEAEHQQANAIWRDLRKDYGDDVALPKARKRFEAEVAQLSARAGKGSAKVVSRTMGPMDAKTYREKLDAFAEQNFGSGSASESAAGDASAPKDAG
jgi:TPR repeat protein